MMTKYSLNKSIIVLILLLISTTCICCKNEEVEKTPDVTKEAFSDIPVLEIIEKILNNIKTIDEYYVYTTGKTLAKKGITYNQDTITKTYKISNSFFKEVVSHSLIVNEEHQAYYLPDKVYYRNDFDDDYDVVTIDAYLEEYGTISSDETIFNYIITSDTIIDYGYIHNDDKWTIYLDIDPDKGAENIKTQMVKFGGLSEKPVFSSIKSYITIDETFKLYSFRSEEKYVLNKRIIGEVDCFQELSSIFYNNKETYILPDLSFLK